MSMVPLALWLLPILMQLSTLFCFLVWSATSRIPLLYRMTLGQFWFALAAALMVVLAALPAGAAAFSTNLFVVVLDLNMVFVLVFVPARRRWTRRVTRGLLPLGVMIPVLAVWQIIAPRYALSVESIVRASVLYALVAGSFLLFLTARAIVRRSEPRTGGLWPAFRRVAEGPAAAAAALGIRKTRAALIPDTRVVIFRSSSPGKQNISSGRSPGICAREEFWEDFGEDPGASTILTRRRLAVSVNAGFDSSIRARPPPGPFQ